MLRGYFQVCACEVEGKQVEGNEPVNETKWRLMDRAWILIKYVVSSWYKSFTGIVCRCGNRWIDISWTDCWLVCQPSNCFPSSSAPLTLQLSQSLIWLKLFVFNTSTKGTAEHFNCLYMYLLGGGWCDKQPLLLSLWALLWLKAVKIFGLQVIMTFISARIGFQLVKLPEYLDQELLLTYIFSESLSLLAITCFSLY